MAYGVLFGGIAGLIGCFLPLGDVHGLVYWDLVEIDRFEILFTLGGYAITIALAAAAFVRPQWRRALAASAAVVFAIVLVRLHVPIDFILVGHVGAKLMAGGPVIGIGFALVGVLKARAAS